MSSRHLMRRTKALLERETSYRRISKSRSWILKASTNRSLHRQFAATCTLLEGTPMRGWQPPTMRSSDRIWIRNDEIPNGFAADKHPLKWGRPTLISKFAKWSQLAD